MIYLNRTRKSPGPKPELKLFLNFNDRSVLTHNDKEEVNILNYVFNTHHTSSDMYPTQVHTSDVVDVSQALANLPDEVIDRLSEETAILASRRGSKVRFN